MTYTLVICRGNGVYVEDYCQCRNPTSFRASLGDETSFSCNVDQSVITVASMDKAWMLGLYDYLATYGEWKMIARVVSDRVPVDDDREDRSLPVLLPRIAAIYERRDHYAKMLAG